MRLVPLVASALLVAAVCARPAVADSNADEAEVRFRVAAGLYKAGRYEEALAEFFASNRLAPNRNVVFNIARSFEALGRFDEAYRYYADYRATEPDEAERASLDRRLAELAPRVALLRVASDPPGATVYVDRKDLGGRGETPLVLPYAPGPHTVIVERPGHHPATAEVTLVRGEEVAIDLALVPITGRVEIRSRPSGQVFVDRAAGDPRPAVADATPAAIALSPGRHTIEIVAPDHRTHRGDVIVRADRVTTVDVELERRPPPSGTVVLRANLPGALVVVDGEERGFTPAVLSLRVGAHEVEVRAPGHQPWRQTIAVEKDGRSFHEIELVEREAEVVGASRRVEAVSRAPASVTLLDRAELRAFGYRTLAEALGGVRGVYASDDRSYQALGVRGFSRPGDYTNRVLVTRDGHAMNDDWIGSAAVGRDFAPDLEDVERIEVIRGPGSTLYGAGAFFGVVNVVSRAPGAGPPVRAGGELDSRGGGSAFAHGQTTGRLGGLTLHASAYDSDGEDFEDPYFADRAERGIARDADGEDAQRVAARALLGPVTLQAGYARRRKDMPTAPFETVFDPASSEATDGLVTHAIDRRGYVEAVFERAARGAQWTARLAYDHQRYDGLYPYDFDGEAFVFTDRGAGRWLTAEGRVALDLPHNQVTVGVEAVAHDVRQGFDEDRDGVDEFDDRHRFGSGSLYLLDRIALGDRLAITAGGRLDRFGPQEDTAISPRLAVVAAPYRGGATKLIVGRAFRAPSVYELHYNDGGITQVAPESLEPETIWTGELEHVHALGRGAYLLGSVFGSRIESLIVDPEDDELILLENSPDAVRTFGGELEARLQRGKAWLSGAVSATKVATDDATARVNSSPVVGALRGFWPAADDTALAAELVYNAPRRLRGGGRTEHVALLGLTATHRLTGTELLLRAGVANLLDQAWSIPVGTEYEQTSIPQRGRTFSLQLIYEPR